MTTEVSCQILARQSTFWDIAAGPRVERVHFVDKHEFSFATDPASSYALYEEHPLLLDYHCGWEQLHISSVVSDAEALTRRLEALISLLTDHWRSPYRYLTETDPVRMLSEGYGQLIHAPEPIAREADRALRASGARTKLIAGRPAVGAGKALVVGRSFVVARDFKIELIVT